MTIIGLHGSWRVALSEDNPTAVYNILDWLEWSEPGTDQGNQLIPVRVLAEVFRSEGGKGQWAMLGGEFRMEGQANRRIRLGQSSDLSEGTATTSSSALRRHALAPGLPPEFARAALAGMVQIPAERPPNFLITVDRASHDAVDSSEYSFKFVGGLLLIALLMRARGAELDSHILSEIHLPGYLACIGSALRTVSDDTILREFKADLQGGLGTVR